MNASNGDPRRIFGTVLLVPVLIGVLLTTVLASSMMRAANGNNPAMRYYEADRIASTAAERWVVSATADSLASWVTTLRLPADSLAIQVAADVPPRVNAIADSVLRAEWRAIAPHREDVRVAVRIVLDTARDAGSLKRTHERFPLYVMPWKTDNRTCVTVIRVSRTVASEPVLMLKSGIAQLYEPPTLGSCAYIAALGMPGANARQWMDDVGNRRAVRAQWWRDHNIADVSDVGAAARALNYQERLFEARRSPALSACRRGDEASCAQLLEPGVNTANADASARGISPVVIPPRGVLMPVSREGTSPLGAMLSDFIKQVGIEQAGVAWRGNMPFIKTLAENAKMSPSALGASWIRTSVPREADGSGSIGFVAIVASLSAGLLMMALGLVTARSRERA